MYAGVSKLIPDRPSASTVPSHVPGKTVGVNLIIAQSYLDALPADYKIATGAQPNHITHWWRLDNLLVDTEGQSISGWLAEQNPMTTRHSPWEWHDFDHIEDTDLPKNSLAYLLNALRCLTDSELASYRGLIDQSDKGPVKSRLYEIIDTNRDGQITHGEIKAAIQNPWHAQSIAQLILRQKSEWFWDKEKWNSLDDLLLTRDPGWQFEKERIEKLSWWNKVSEKSALPTNAAAWCLHPIILIMNFTRERRRLRNSDLGELSKEYETSGRGSITISHGSGDIGGKSYGAYQMTSQVTLSDGSIIRGGTIEKFIKWPEFPWREEFEGLIPGSPELVWSTAVQYGPSTTIIASIINSLSIPQSKTKVYDSKLIDLIYEERGRRIVGGEKDGQLYHFRRNALGMQDGVARRFILERRKAQEMLHNEDYD